ncbi:MAG TPA: AmmeMemoRadiSam system protein A [Victivallales bacterium]|nr:AmmeMemoRadiSam system protein A [Victivallales bacterium]
MSQEILSESEKAALLKIARSTIKSALLGEKQEAPYSFCKIFESKMSCFVTLHGRDGNLRGCIGNIQAFEPLVDNVKANALNSAFRDPRFRPLKEDELDSINIEISVLTPPVPIKDYKEIEVGRHGIILQKGSRSSVFLPQVATEQGWDLETTLCHLSMKAGMGAYDWKDAKTKFSVFEAVVFSEK